MGGVVIVDDDPLMRSLLLEWVGGAGYTASALAHAHADVPAGELLIMDIFMPRGDGARQLQRARAAHPHTPIIAISGQFERGLDASAATAESLGVHRLIAKPFTRQTLLDAIRAAIGPPRAGAAHA